MAQIITAVAKVVEVELTHSVFYSNTFMGAFDSQADAEFFIDLRVPRVGTQKADYRIVEL